MGFPTMRVGPVQPDFFSLLIFGLSRLKSEYFSKIRFEPAQSDHLPATILIEPAQSKLCSTIRIEPAQFEESFQKADGASSIRKNREKHVFWEEKGIVWKNPY